MVDSSSAPEPEQVVEDTKDTTATSGKPDGPFNRRPRNKEERPIEELYDLTKPIPKVDKPSKEEHDAEIKAFDELMEKIKAEREAVQAKIEAEMDKGKGSEQGQVKEALAALRNKKGVLIDEKKTIRNKLDQMKDATDKLMRDRKDTRSNIRFTKVEDIDAEIAKLKRRQETTSMSLPEEKKLIKEIDSLQASKKFVVELKAKEGNLEDIKEQRKAVTAQLTAKDAEIDAVTKEIEATQAKLKEISDRETDKRDAVKALMAEREELRKKTTATLKDKDACRAAYREKSDAFYNYQRAIRAVKKLQYEEEKKRREAEREAYLKAKEEEEAKKIPYEEEQGLCEYLADYLERTYISADGKTAAEKEAEEAKNKVVQVKDDPFAGLKPVSKKDDDDEYCGKGKGKKKRVRANKKQDAKDGPFRLNVDTFEQFGLIGLTPPTSLEMVAKSVEDLRARKVWYSQQPRGSVPTATEIRKANERTAAKLKNSTGDATTTAAATTTTTTSSSSSGKQFVLSTDDFVPLSASVGAGAGAAATATSTWGQKSSDDGGDNGATAEEAATNDDDDQPDES